jgi:carbon-monoxide dehydrogenase medium subunit
MKDFVFHRPASLAAAVAALKDRPDAKFLGGGQSLIPVMKLGLAAPSDLVALSALAELAGIRRDGSALEIGAATTHVQVADSAEVRGAIPALAELAANIGDPQVRNRGTLGGSLAHDDPGADYPAAVLALGATILTDRRAIPADEYFQGLYQTALAPDEVIRAVRFPLQDRAAYAKFHHPASRFALVGVFVARGAQGARVAVTGAGASVFRVPEMERALAARWHPDALSGITVSPAELTGDGLASAEYRAHLIGVMARRAVAACG